jgi:hypothetical protein
VGAEAKTCQKGEGGTPGRTGARDLRQKIEAIGVHLRAPFPYVTSRNAERGTHHAELEPRLMLSLLSALIRLYRSYVKTVGLMALPAAG